MSAILSACKIRNMEEHRPEYRRIPTKPKGATEVRWYERVRVRDVGEQRQFAQPQLHNSGPEPHRSCWQRNMISRFAKSFLAIVIALVILQCLRDDKFNLLLPDSSSSPRSHFCILLPGHTSSHGLESCFPSTQPQVQGKIRAHFTLMFMVLSSCQN